MWSSFSKSTSDSRKREFRCLSGLRALVTTGLKTTYTDSASDLLNWEYDNTHAPPRSQKTSDHQAWR
jgi:hypothetical protein